MYLCCSVSSVVLSVFVSHFSVTVISISSTTAIGTMVKLIIDRRRSTMVRFTIVTVIISSVRRRTTFIHIVVCLLTWIASCIATLSRRWMTSRSSSSALVKVSTLLITSSRSCITASTRRCSVGSTRINWPSSRMCRGLQLGFHVARVYSISPLSNWVPESIVSWWRSTLLLNLGWSSLISFFLSRFFNSDCFPFARLNSQYVWSCCLLTWWCRFTTWLWDRCCSALAIICMLIWRSLIGNSLFSLNMYSFSRFRRGKLWSFIWLRRPFSNVIYHSARLYLFSRPVILRFFWQIFINFLWAMIFYSHLCMCSWASNESLWRCFRVLCLWCRAWFLSISVLWNNWLSRSITILFLSRSRLWVWLYWFFWCCASSCRSRSRRSTWFTHWLDCSRILIGKSSFFIFSTLLEFRETRNFLF